ncbi:CHAT domain-containing protein, partial [Ephemerocybe angulata]
WSRGLLVDQSSDTTLPRIWWCPTGPLSFLPIHAAGIYGKTVSESVMDYAILSYIPTVAALADRIKNRQSIDKERTGVVMVSQPKVDGAASIPGTTTEVRSVYGVVKAVGMRAEKFEETEITAAGCLACHGSQNAKDPLQSRFLFHDGSLELGTIVQRSLKNADLAFLSACQTSTGVDDLPDEAVHLAAGMLAAGYRRVVATMWSIGDRDAPAVATDFYQYLLDHRSSDMEGGLEGRFSANALHHATKQLRLRLDDNSDQSLLTWIPYVHFGY